MAAFSGREAGPPETSADSAERASPAPTAGTAIAAIAPVEQFVERVRHAADRLRVTTEPVITVLADGAEWIWNMADQVFPQAVGVLDVYRAVERLATATKTIRDDASPAAVAQLDAGRAG